MTPEDPARREIEYADALPNSGVTAGRIDGPGMRFACGCEVTPYRISHCEFSRPSSAAPPTGFSPEDLARLASELVRILIEARVIPRSGPRNKSGNVRHDKARAIVVSWLLARCSPPPAPSAGGAT